MAKKRSKRKSLILTAAACLVLLLLLAAAVYELLLPAGPVFSDRENRMLAEKPAFSWKAFFDGSFADDLEKYLADRFPGRMGFIDFTRQLRQVGSLATWDDYAQVAENNVEMMEDMGDLFEDDVMVTPRPTKGPVDVESFPREMHLYLLDGTKKNAAISRSRNQLYSESSLFNAYASLLPEGGIFALTIVPNSIRATRLLSYSDPQGMTSEIEPFLQAVTADNVAVFSTADRLSEPLIRGEYVFFRSDMHWTPYGAYLVVSDMLAEAGETLPPYDAFPKTQEYPFLGTLYRDSLNKQMEANPDTLDILTPLRPVRVRRYTTPQKYEEVPFIEENANPRDRYTVYLGGANGNWTVVERTDIPEEQIQKTCLVISDSYGLCTMPFFAQVYDRVILYDSRYYEKYAMGAVSDLIESWGVQDIYLVAGEGNVYEKHFLAACSHQY